MISSYTDLHYIIGDNITLSLSIYQLLGNNKKFMEDFSVPVYYDLAQPVRFIHR